MRFTVLIIACTSLLWLCGSCEQDNSKRASALSDMDKTSYYASEIFVERHQSIYGKWKLYAVSGGFTGNGHDLNFDFLEVKPYGIYGFIRNDSLLEYGKIIPKNQDLKINMLDVEFIKDEYPEAFFDDPFKLIYFEGNDKLHLNSPCCDRYNYHFKRIW